MKISENIKLNFLRKKLKKSGGKNREVKIKLPNQFLRVLIISSNENDSFFKKAATLFLNAELNSLYLRKQKEDITVQFRYSVHESDFNLTGTLKNDKLIRLSHSKFDLIIDLSNNSDLLNYFLQNAQSELIIGKLGNSVDELHDLCFDFDSNEENFLATINKQLNHLAHGQK